jgi:hypothetical protein
MTTAQPGQMAALSGGPAGRTAGAAHRPAREAIATVSPRSGGWPVAEPNCADDRNVAPFGRGMEHPRQRQPLGGALSPG